MQPSQAKELTDPKGYYPHGLEGHAIKKGAKLSCGWGGSLQKKLRGSRRDGRVTVFRYTKQHKRCEMVVGRGWC